MAPYDVHSTQKISIDIKKEEKIHAVSFDGENNYGL
jgi:hypothetical protein